VKAFRLGGALETESPRLARLFELGCVGVAEVAGADGPQLLAYFPEAIDLQLDGRWEDVADVDYLADYRRRLLPVRAGGLMVTPSHRTVELSVGEQVVWLDPGSVFGTGHHESTRLALAALWQLDLVGLSVLDVGAGSGILAIAADRLGAGSAIGVDRDPATVPVARANARLNRSRARFLAGSVDHPELPRRVDVIVANLYAELHVALMEAYLVKLGAGGKLLLSGILTRLEPSVREALPATSPCKVRREGEWSFLEVACPARQASA